jgi:hypothetical protein
MQQCSMCRRQFFLRSTSSDNSECGRYKRFREALNESELEESAFVTVGQLIGQNVERHK